MYLFVADSYFLSRFIKKFPCLYTNKNLERALQENLLDNKSQIELLIDLLNFEYYHKHLVT